MQQNEEIYYINPVPSDPKCMYITSRLINQEVERGHLQYQIIPELLIKLSITNEELLDFIIEEITEDNLKRLLPLTKTAGDINDYKLLLVIKSKRDNNLICLKGALLNKKTNRIALMTSFNNETHITRAIKSHDSNYFIGHYRLSAPPKFWSELIKIVKQEVNTNNTNNSKCKTNVPKIHKKLIWETYIGIDKGREKCLCCNMNNIDPFDFHMGHIIPKSKGGSMCKENLRPICSQCNHSMNNENMIDFMKRLNYDIERLKYDSEQNQDPKLVQNQDSKLTIKCIMRNNQWDRHKNVFDTIIYTKKIVSPWGHWKETNKLFNEGKFNNEKFSHIFINDININDYILMFHKTYDYALVLKITSESIAERLNNIIILRENKCNHTPLVKDCKECNDSILEIFSSKYFEENHKLYTKYLNEDYKFENMYAIIRNVEIIGKINNTCDVFNKGKNLQNSISRRTFEIDKKDINEQLDRNIDSKKNDQIDSDNNIIL